MASVKTIQELLSSKGLSTGGPIGSTETLSNVAARANYGQNIFANSARPSKEITTNNSGTTCRTYNPDLHGPVSVVPTSLQHIYDKVNSYPTLLCASVVDATCGCLANTYTTCNCNARCTCNSDKHCVQGKYSGCWQASYQSNTCNCNARCACNTEKRFG